MGFTRRTACVAVAILGFGLSAELQANPLIMAHGWSVNPAGGAAAIEEAVAMMQNTLDDPTCIVLYTTAGYGEREICDKLRQRFPKAKLFGMNVYKGVFTSDGLHLGKRGALAIMGFAGGDLVFGVGASEVRDGADVVDLTGNTIAAAVRDAGKTPQDKPAVILLGATKGREDAIVAGIADTLANDIPLIGGTHCTDTFGQGFVVGNGVLHKPGVVIGLIYSDAKIGASFSSGFVGKKKSGRITSGQGRLLREIDGRPAQDVYREWAMGHFDNIDCTTKSVLVMSSAVCPLAKAIRLPNGRMRYIPVRPWRFNPDGSLNMGGDIHAGDAVYYVEGNKRALRKRAGVVTRDALVNGNIKIKDIAGGLHIYCGGAAKTLGLGKGAEAGKLVDEVRAYMGGQPFIGGFTAGEQGTIPGYGYFHGNLMSSMVIFAR